MIRALLTVWCFAAAMASPTGVATEEQPVLVKATFEPGGTAHDLYAWRISISGDGVATEEIKTTPGWHAPDHWRRLPTWNISSRRLAALGRILESTGFCGLRNDYSASYEIDSRRARVVTDQDTVTITAQCETIAKEVKVYGPEIVAGIWDAEETHPDREAGKQFCRVWAEVLAAARPPNSFQKPALYR